MNIIFRSWLYSFLYAVGDQLIKRHNPCQIQKDAAGVVRCLDKEKDSSLCCTSCNFLGPDGCTTECLSCKLHLCYMTEKADPKVPVLLYDILYEMRTIAWKYDLAGIRMSKKMIFDLLRPKMRFRKAMAKTKKGLEEVLENAMVRNRGMS